MPDKTDHFFRIRCGTVRREGQDVPAWLYEAANDPRRGTGTAPLQVTAIPAAAIVLPEPTARKMLAKLSPLFPAELEPATFAEWIDQGGTPTERPEPAGGNSELKNP